jgi:hypothetical protein
MDPFPQKQIHHPEYYSAYAAASPSLLDPFVVRRLPPLRSSCLLVSTKSNKNLSHCPHFTKNGRYLQLSIFRELLSFTQLRVSKIVLLNRTRLEATQQQSMAISALQIQAQMISHEYSDAQTYLVYLKCLT